MTRNELVEKMICASAEALNINRFNHETVTTGMSAALDVALDACLGPLAAQERGIAGADYCTRPAVLPCDYNDVLQFALKNFIASRRAALAHVKTAEERVTVVEWLHDTSKWIVLIDGWNSKNSATFDKKDRDKAETFRIGLIQQLKEQP